VFFFVPDEAVEKIFLFSGRGLGEPSCKTLSTLLPSSSPPEGVQFVSSRGDLFQHICLCWSKTFFHVFKGVTSEGVSVFPFCTSSAAGDNRYFSSSAMLRNIFWPTGLVVFLRTECGEINCLSAPFSLPFIEFHAASLQENVSSCILFFIVVSRPVSSDCQHPRFTRYGSSSPDGFLILTAFFLSKRETISQKGIGPERLVKKSLCFERLFLLEWFSMKKCTLLLPCITSKVIWQNSDMHSAHLSFVP